MKTSSAFWRCDLWVYEAKALTLLLTVPLMLQAAAQQVVESENGDAQFANLAGPGSPFANGSIQVGQGFTANASTVPTYFRTDIEPASIQAPEWNASLAVAREASELSRALDSSLSFSLKYKTGVTNVSSSAVLNLAKSFKEERNTIDLVIKVEGITAEYRADRDNIELKSRRDRNEVETLQDTGFFTFDATARTEKLLNKIGHDYITYVAKGAVVYCVIKISNYSKDEMERLSVDFGLDASYSGANLAVDASVEKAFQRSVEEKNFDVEYFVSGSPNSVAATGLDNLVRNAITGSEGNIYECYRGVTSAATDFISNHAVEYATVREFHTIPMRRALELEPPFNSEFAHYLPTIDDPIQKFILARGEYTKYISDGVTSPDDDFFYQTLGTYSEDLLKLIKTSLTSGAYDESQFESLRNAYEAGYGGVGKLGGYRLLPSGLVRVRQAKNDDGIEYDAIAEFSLYGEFSHGGINQPVNCGNWVGDGRIEKGEVTFYDKSGDKIMTANLTLDEELDRDRGDLQIVTSPILIPIAARSFSLKCTGKGSINTGERDVAGASKWVPRIRYGRSDRTLEPVHSGGNGHHNLGNGVCGHGIEFGEWENSPAVIAKPRRDIWQF